MMAETHKTRLDRLETRSGGGKRILIVIEDEQGALTLGGAPWAKDQAGARDIVVILKSFAGGDA